MCLAPSKWTIHHDLIKYIIKKWTGRFNGNCFPDECKKLLALVMNFQDGYI